MIFEQFDIFLMYLRKSRTDLEAEAKGEGDTLKRHERTLRDLSKHLGIHVPEENIYREVVSGETLTERTEMRKILKRLQDENIKGVLVAEVERLTRGDPIDQGLVAQTFKYTNTLIITPLKTYDPNNEADEEYLEFGMFKSRGEYKTTTRRLVRGRKSSAMEGKFIGSSAPYGYTKRKLKGQKGYTLDINPDEEEAIKIIYDLYVNQNKGVAYIAGELDKYGFKPRTTEKWSWRTIRSLLPNPAYAGYIGHRRSPQIKTMKNGQIEKHRPVNHDYERYHAIHQAIIDPELWERAQDKFSQNIRPRVNLGFAVKNPFAGIAYCGICGRAMYRKPCNGRPARFVCENKCGNKGSYFPLVEEDAINAIDKWLQEYKLEVSINPQGVSEIQRIESAIKKATEESAAIDGQIDKLRDLLERDVYTIEVYMDRFRMLSSQKKEIDRRVCELTDEFSSLLLMRPEIVIPRMEHVLNTYYSLQDPEQRNILLKTAIKRIEYAKTGNGERNYTLKITPLFSAPD